MSPFLWSQRDLVNSTSPHGNGTAAGPPAPVPSLIIAYDVIYAFGTFLLMVLWLAAFLDRRIKRRDLWFMTIFSWWLASSGNLLLIGQQMTVEQPNPGICLVQAMMIYSGPAFAAATSASFMLQIYYTLDPSASFNRKRRWSILLHTVPIVLLLIIMGSVLVVGPITKSEIIERDSSGMYCHVVAVDHISWPLIIGGGTSAFCITIIFVIEVFIFRSLRRTVKSPYSLPAINANIIRDISKRVMIFCIWSFLCMALSLIQVVPAENGLNPIMQILQATLPTAAALIFGTQKDLMQVWCFWRRDVYVE